MIWVQCCPALLKEQFQLGLPELSCSLSGLVGAPPQCQLMWLIHVMLSDGLKQFDTVSAEIFEAVL